MSTDTSLWAPPNFFFFLPILAGPHTFKGLFEGLRGKVRIGLCLGFGVHNEWKSTRCPHKPVCQCVCTGYTICSIQIIFLQFIGSYWISVLHFNLTVDFWLQSFERDIPSSYKHDWRKKQQEFISQSLLWKIQWISSDIIKPMILKNK